MIFPVCPLYVVIGLVAVVIGGDCDNCVGEYVHNKRVVQIELL